MGRNAGEVVCPTNHGDADVGSGPGIPFITKDTKVIVLLAATESLRYAQLVRLLFAESP